MENEKNVSIEPKLMTVLQFIQSDIEADIYDDYQEALGIAKCGSYMLTDEGMKYFEPILDLIVRVDERFNDAVLEINDFIFEEDGYVLGGKGYLPSLLYRACELFEGLAGYCSVEKYDKWFIEVETGDK